MKGAFQVRTPRAPLLVLHRPWRTVLFFKPLLQHFAWEQTFEGIDQLLMGRDQSDRHSLLDERKDVRAEQSDNGRQEFARQPVNQTLQPLNVLVIGV